MTRRGFLRMVGAGAAGLALMARARRLGLATEQPNVVVVLCDDLGYGDVQCYNPERGRIPTPQIDSLAAAGMRFTDAHSSAAVSSPSRYALLTGRYRWREGFQEPQRRRWRAPRPCPTRRFPCWTPLSGGIVSPFGPPLIAPERLTIAGLARQQGYRTACFGKWHLGWDWPVSAEERKLLGPLRPPRRKEAPQVAGPEHQAAWQKIFSQPIPGGPTSRGFRQYFGPDVPNWPPYCFLENDRTVGIPSEFLPSELVANSLASVPGPAVPGWRLEGVLPAIADRAVTFIEQTAQAGQPFLLYLPLTAPHAPLAVNEEWRGKSGLNNRAADLIMEADATVGRVLDALEHSGVANETLVLFTSDNGFAPRVGRAKQLEAQGHFPSGPLRGYKFDPWEGGHRVPFIVRWPGVVRPGSVCDQLIHQADLIATLAALWGAPLPPDAGEDSFNLLPVLRGEKVSPRPHAVSCSWGGVPAVRQGEWKLILSRRPELYNLADDLGETRNLADAEPDRVAAMRRLLEDIIAAGRSTPGPDQSPGVLAERRRA